MVPKVCSEQDCITPTHARGLCKSHYGKRATLGTLPPRSSATLEERFWAKVKKTGTCWLWTGHVSKSGYGRFRVKGYAESAHRVSYEISIGAIPEGLDVDHVCRQKSCVNPDHLRAATRKQNMENRSGAQKNNLSSGVLGVSWNKPAKRWRAKIKHNGKSMHIGNYLTLAEAEKAAVSRRLELFTHNAIDRGTPSERKEQA